jgi:thiamine pyrophosphokinase
MKNFRLGNYDIVIFANGEKPVHEIPVSITIDARYAVCCDGALSKMEELGRKPDFVVGDCDSLSPETIESLGERLVKITEQETNDLSKAFHFALKRFDISDPKIAIVGATGVREDHTIGNVFHLLDFSSFAPDVTMVSNFGFFSVVKGSRSFACSAGSPVSVFAPLPGTNIVSDGLAWPLEGVNFPHLWSGTLNKTTADGFSLAANKPVIVYMPF